MRRIPIHELVHPPQGVVHICHESGELLGSTRSAVQPETVALLARAGIRSVVVLDGYDNVVQFWITSRNKFILVNELGNDHSIVGPIVTTDGTILYRKGDPVGDSLRQKLKSAGIYSIPVRKEPRELKQHQVVFFRKLLANRRVAERVKPVLI